MKYVALSLLAISVGCLSEYDATMRSLNAEIAVLDRLEREKAGLIVKRETALSAIDALELPISEELTSKQEIIAITLPQITEVQSEIDKQVVRVQLLKRKRDMLSD